MDLRKLINKAFDWYYEENIHHTNMGNDEATDMFLETVICDKTTTHNEDLSTLSNILSKNLLFDSENEKADFILDILNEYKVELNKN